MQRKVSGKIFGDVVDEVDSIHSVQVNAIPVFADPSVCDAPRILRLAGFKHQKGKPFVSRIMKGRARLTNNDRSFFVQMYRCFPSILKAVTIVQPETLESWHRAGFRRNWCWKSRRRGGRPRVEMEVRALIRLMSTENQLWGAPRIYGELLKLGFSVAQSSVAKYMAKRRGPPSQGWKTFLRSHAPDIAAMDLFVVPTIGFRLLYSNCLRPRRKAGVVSMATTSCQNSFSV
jgi:hypothetical protein